MTRTPLPLPANSLKPASRRRSSAADTIARTHISSAPPPPSVTGTAFPIGGWPSVADVLSAALRPESPGAQPKPFSAIELKRRQLQDKLAHNKGAPLMPTTTSVELLLEPPLTHPPAVRTHLKRQQSQHQSKRAHINREAPRTTFYRRLGRRNM